MKISTLTIEDIERLLQTQPEFSNLESWKFETINMGEMTHKYKLKKGNRVYFVKEVKKHEAQVIHFLYHLELSRIPSTRFPELLKHKVQVRAFIPGEILQCRKLDLGLIREFALFQNRMNDKVFFDKYNLLGLDNYELKDDGFFSKGLTSDFACAQIKVKQLSSMYNLKIIDKFWEILKHLKKDEQAIIDDFSSMPFARQHHDFREDNIVGKPQKLIDWGSSYGYGPFLFDLTQFLINDPIGFETYVKASDICKKASMIQVERWIYVTLAAKFLEILRWHLHPTEARAILHTEKKCKDFLIYEYQTYKRLLE